jgi:hypothetical protein
MARPIRAWPHPASAHHRISVGILVRSPLLWPFALGSDLDASVCVPRVKAAISGTCRTSASARCCRWRVRHAPSIQWGNNRLMVGIWVLDGHRRARRPPVHQPATWRPSCLLVCLQCADWHAPGRQRGPLTGPISVLIFFMLTDPKTTVGGRVGAGARGSSWRRGVMPRLAEVVTRRSTRCSGGAVCVADRGVLVARRAFR